MQNQFRTNIRPPGIALAALTVFLLVGTASAANTENIPALQEKACRVVPPENIQNYVNTDTGTILNGNNAVKLIEALLITDAPSICIPNTKAKDYLDSNFKDLDKGGALNTSAVEKGDFIIHTVAFGAATTTNGQTAQPVAQQTWYLLHQGQLLRPGRLLGTKRLWFIYVHLNKNPNYTYQTQYTFTVTDAIPANQQNLISFLGAIGPTAETKSLAAMPQNVWGGLQIDMTSGTSDISINANVIVDGKAQPLDSKAQTIHNEAPEWWDVSAGIPIKKMSQLTFPAAGSSGTVTPTQVDKKSIYGLADFYWLRAQRTQMMYNGYSLIPSIITGLAASQKPLQKPLFAMGVGLSSIQVYAGVIVAKQPEVPAGAMVTGKPCTGWCPEFAFGINLTVKGLQNQLKSKPANSRSAGNSVKGTPSPGATPPTS